MIHARLLMGTAALALLAGCAGGDGGAAAGGGNANAAGTAGQAAVQDNDSQKDIVKVAAGSKDHATLVAAVKAADLVNSLSNAGPFTVFAPTNAAFDKLPAGTVETLLKPENKDKLTGVLTHHVTTSALEITQFTDGQMVGMADGGSVQVTKKGNDTFIGGAKVLGSVRASNGWVHVIDAVLVPK
mgnify:FL=1|jgi:uncharacterized surface protein with fasciclin (FAS1) repeats